MKLCLAGALCLIAGVAALEVSPRGPERDGVVVA